MKRWPPLLVISLLFLGLLMLASLLAASRTLSPINLDISLQEPSVAHIFGTDSLGRDLFWRVLEASRVSLVIGILTTVGAFVIALVVCFIAVMGPRWLDTMVMRLVEIFMALPSLVVISLAVLLFNSWLAVESLFSRLLALGLALTLTSWFALARQIRSLLEVEKNKNYVESARALGAHPLRIYARHILPNLATPLLVMLGLQIPNQLLFESFLSFAGIGLQPPMASWGILIQEGWKTLSAYPHLILIPSLILFLTVLAFNLIFEEIRASLRGAR